MRYISLCFLHEALTGPEYYEEGGVSYFASGGGAGIVVRNMLVTYDRSNQQIGFLKTNCTNLWSTLPADTSPPTAQASLPVVPAPSEIPQSPLPAVGSALPSPHSAPSSAPSLNSFGTVL